MEARKRAANKRRKLKSMGKSKSTETDDDEEDADEGKKLHFYPMIQHKVVFGFSIFILHYNFHFATINSGKLS